jgi:hypothetical protein
LKIQKEGLESLVNDKDKEINHMKGQVAKAETMAKNAVEEYQKRTVEIEN